MSDRESKKEYSFDELIRIEEKFEHTAENNERGGYTYGLTSPLGHIGSIGHYGADSLLTDNQIADFKSREGSISLDDDIKFDKQVTRKTSINPKKFEKEPELVQPAKSSVPEFGVPVRAGAETEPIRERADSVNNMPAVEPTSEIHERTETETGENHPETQIKQKEYNKCNNNKSYANHKNAIEYSSSEIVINRLNECICLLKQQKTLNNDFSEKSINNRCKIIYEEISKGIIDFWGNRKIVNFDGETHEYIAVHYCRNHSVTEGLLDKNKLIENPEILYDIALKNRVVFENKKYASIVSDYLLTISSNCEQNEKTYKSFYIGDDGRLHHPNETEILLDSASPENLKRYLGINTDKAEDTSYSEVILLFIRLLSELRALGYITTFPIFIISAADHVEALREIAELLGEDRIYKVERSMVSKGNENIRIFDLCSSTKYNIDKYLPELMQDSTVHPTVYVTNNTKCFIKREYESNTIVLPWKGKRKNVRIYNQTRTTFLRKNIRPAEWNDVVSEVDTSEYPSEISDFISRLILSIWIVLSDITDKNSAENYIDRIKQFIVYEDSGLSENIRNQLKKQLRSSCTGVYVNRAGNAIVATDVLKSWANMCLWPSDFSTKLAENGILSRSDLSFQKTATINGKSHRVYEFSQDRLFSYGELRTVSNDFANKAPDMMIPFGYCCEKEVFLAFDEASDDTGYNIMVTGGQSSCETSAVNRLIRGISGQSISVIIPLCTEKTAYIDNAVHYLYRGGKLYNYSQGNDGYKENDGSEKATFHDVMVYVHFADNFSKNDLSRFISDFVIQEENNNVNARIVVIDETWDCSLPLIAWFIKKLIRVGCGNKVINCISINELKRETVSFINDIYSKISVFIREGNETLKLIEKRILGIPSGESEEAHIAESLPDNCCLAVGALATEKGYIRDPIIVEL